MERLDSKITLSGQVFTFCTEVSIDSSYDNLTDKAAFVIPKKLRYKKEDGTNADSITRGKDALFKIGDPASIEVGYNAKIKQVFAGFISGVRQKFPLRFNLEDEVYKLKQQNHTLSFESTKLSDLLAAILPLGVIYEIEGDRNLGQFRINDATAAQVLDELRKKYGVYSFFRDSILYVGPSIVEKLQKTFTFEFNTPTLINGDSLTYVDAQERKIKVVCKSIASDNTTLEATAGDESGEVRTLYFNNYSLSDLQKTADESVNELKYSGYDGYFTIFATPAVNHGDVVRLINKTIPEQNGGYLVTRVVTRFGFSIGGRQDVYIKQKIYDLDSNGKEIPINE